MLRRANFGNENAMMAFEEKPARRRGIAVMHRCHAVVLRLAASCRAEQQFSPGSAQVQAQATRERFRNAGIELTTSGLLELPAMNGLHGCARIAVFVYKAANLSNRAPVPGSC